MIATTMLLPLLLQAQAATLPADTGQAGRMCTSAVSFGSTASDDPIELTAHLTYFLMTALKAEGGSADFLKRVNSAFDDPAKRPQEIAAETARALITQCDARFPKARASGAAKLPSDPFRSQVLCLGAVGVVLGAAQGLKENGGDPTAYNRWKPVSDGLQSRLTDNFLASHGITTEEQFNTLLGNELAGSLAAGNLLAISTSCQAAYPGT